MKGQNVRASAKVAKSQKRLHRATPASCTLALRRSLNEPVRLSQNQRSRELTFTVAEKAAALWEIVKWWWTEEIEIEAATARARQSISSFW